MDVRESLVLEKPEELRQWLQDNHRTKVEIWLVFYKKSSHRQTLTIVQAVEGSLALWLDPEQIQTARPAVLHCALLAAPQGKYLVAP